MELAIARSISTHSVFRRLRERPLSPDTLAICFRMNFQILICSVRRHIPPPLSPGSPCSGPKTMPATADSTQIHLKNQFSQEFSANLVRCFAITSLRSSHRFICLHRRDAYSFQRFPFDSTPLRRNLCTSIWPKSSKNATRRGANVYLT